MQVIGFWLLYLFSFTIFFSTKVELNNTKLEAFSHSEYLVILSSYNHILISIIYSFSPFLPPHFGKAIKVNKNANFYTQYVAYWAAARISSKLEFFQLHSYSPAPSSLLPHLLWKKFIPLCFALVSLFYIIFLYIYNQNRSSHFSLETVGPSRH